MPGTWYRTLGTWTEHWVLGTYLVLSTCTGAEWVLNTRYLVLGREGGSEAARTRGGGQPGILDDNHDIDDEGDEQILKAFQAGGWLVSTWTRSRLSKVVGRLCSVRE